MSDLIDLTISPGDASGVFQVPIKTWTSSSTAPGVASSLFAFDEAHRYAAHGGGDDGFARVIKH